MAYYPDVNPKYDEILLSRQISRELWGEYKKWVRFYLHFCGKYQHNPADAKSLPLFIEKLSSKNQMLEQRARAVKAVEYYSVLLLPGNQHQQGQIKMSAGMPPFSKPAIEGIRYSEAVSFKASNNPQISHSLAAETVSHFKTRADDERDLANAG